MVPKCSEIGLERSLRFFSSLRGIEGECGIPTVERGFRGGFSELLCKPTVRHSMQQRLLLLESTYYERKSAQID